MSKSFIIISFILFLSVFLFPASGNRNWLLQLDNKNVFSIDNFNNEFSAFVDLQAVSQVVVDPKSIKEARQNKVNKNMYLENTINDLLIMDYAKQKKIYREKDIEKRLKNINTVLRKQMIRKYFISKVIMPKLKVDEELVKAIYNKLKQSNETKGLSSLEIRDLAKRRARMQSVQRAFAAELDRLRSKHRIKLNDKYDDVFE